MAENVTDVVWVGDPEQLELRYVSPSVERLLGISPEAIHGPAGAQLRAALFDGVTARLEAFVAGDPSAPSTPGGSLPESRSTRRPRSSWRGLDDPGPIAAMHRQERRTIAVVPALHEGHVVACFNLASGRGDAIPAGRRRSSVGGPGATPSSRRYLSKSDTTRLFILGPVPQETTTLLSPRLSASPRLSHVGYLCTRRDGGDRIYQCSA